MPRFVQLLPLLLACITTTAYATASPEAEAAEFVELEARAPAQVISKCTVPNTVALTFVSKADFHPVVTVADEVCVGRRSLPLYVRPYPSSTHLRTVSERTPGERLSVKSKLQAGRLRSSSVSVLATLSTQGLPLIRLSDLRRQ